MYPGQIITYKVNVLPALRMTWVTEISQVEEPFFFVDEQRIGPYKLWHHQHRFKEVNGGIEMTDIVTYALPFGFLGNLANRTFVKNELNRIFDYRNQVLHQKFSLN